MSLGSIVKIVADIRAEMRTNGATREAIDQATERIVRANWPVTDERHWPAWMLIPRCAYCDGTGLVLRRNITNRLGVVVDEGVPCRCAKGGRFIPNVPQPDDFQKAGKSKPKTFTRFGA